MASSRRIKAYILSPDSDMLKGVPDELSFIDADFIYMQTPFEKWDSKWKPILESDIVILMETKNSSDTKDFPELFEIKVAERIRAGKSAPSLTTHPFQTKLSTTVEKLINQTSESLLVDWVLTDSPHDESEGAFFDHKSSPGFSLPQQKKTTTIYYICEASSSANMQVLDNWTKELRRESYKEKSKSAHLIVLQSKINPSDTITLVDAMNLNLTEEEGKKFVSKYRPDLIIHRAALLETEKDFYDAVVKEASHALRETFINPNENIGDKYKAYLREQHLKKYPAAIVVPPAAAAVEEEENPSRRPSTP